MVRARLECLCGGIHRTAAVKAFTLPCALRAARKKHPNADFLLLACDMPHLQAESSAFLLEQQANAFFSDDDLPNPMLSFWTTDIDFQTFNSMRKLLLHPERNIIKAPFPEELKDKDYPGISLHGRRSATDQLAAEKTK